MYLEYIEFYEKNIIYYDYILKNCILFWFLKEEEFELVTVKINYVFGTREDDFIIVFIDLDRRKEEE